MKRLSLTLGQVFTLTIAGLALLLGLLFSLLYRGSRESIVDSSQPLLAAKRDLLGREISAYLQEAQKPIGRIENEIKYESFDAQNPLSVESHLFTEVLNNTDLAEVTFTHASSSGRDEEGILRVAAESRWQVSVFRETPDPESAILTRFTHRVGRRFISEYRQRHRDVLAALLARGVEAGVLDPTEHPTFATVVRNGLYGELVWSDLSYSEIDAGRPEPQRRVVVTVMKALEDKAHRFVGVARVGLRGEKVEAIVREVRDEARKQAPLRLFICDPGARLITRLTPEDRLKEQPDAALRFESDRLPREIAAALKHPALREVRSDHLDTSGRFSCEGRPFLVAFKGLPYSQEWRVAVVVAEDELPGVQKLVETRDKLLMGSLAVMGVILVGGAGTLRVVRRGLGKIVGSTKRMHDFDFAPSGEHSTLRDVQGAIESLELAKTALRAMEKYVPVDLVRLLYQTGREPVLGGELAVVSLMFTDIKDFTAVSERLSPNELARVLGRYLGVMTRAIHVAQGTIDKYIGDAIMAVWNVPNACPGHVHKACQAALDCVSALDELFASAEWAGTPRLQTRFGLHTGEVMVGHFGAPDRMSFTCLGDGVNLASRLEGLNKQYGTTILTSESIHDEAGGAFVFRLLDIVAVKGKTRGVRVYELVGPAGISGPRVEAARRYERAFEAYLRREFDQAIAMTGAQPEDPPSRVLAERCRRMMESPPGADWDGTYVATSK